MECVTRIELREGITKFCKRHIYTEFLINSLDHFMLLISYYTPWKHFEGVQKETMTWNKLMSKFFVTKKPVV